MSGLVQYNSSGSSDSDSDSDSDTSTHEQSLAVKRQKVASLGAKVAASINETSANDIINVKKNSQSQSSGASESIDLEQRDTNSISLFLPAPKRQSNTTNNNNATVKQQPANRDVQHASLSHTTRTLGGGIKNQFNGASIFGHESDDSGNGNSDNDEYNLNQASVQNISVRSSISFLPSSLLRKKKLSNNSKKRSLSKQQANTTDSELDKPSAGDFQQAKANDQEDELALDATTLFPTTANSTANNTASIAPRYGKSSNDYNEEYVAPSISSHPDEIPRPSIIFDPLSTATSTANAAPQFGQIPKDKKIIEFNVDDFYSTNNELLRTGQLQQVDAYTSGSNAIKNINVNGRNQLSSLVRFAQDEENSQALKEKFEKEKQGKRKIRERYGW